MDSVFKCTCCLDTGVLLLRGCDPNKQHEPGFHESELCPKCKGGVMEQMTSREIYESMQGSLMHPDLFMTQEEMQEEHERYMDRVNGLVSQEPEDERG